MAHIQKGTFGVAWSLGTTASGTGIGTNQMQSVDWGNEPGDLREIKVGPDADTKLLVLSDPRQDISIEFVPSGATIALANAANTTPALGADVTIADANDGEIAAVYVCIGVQKRKVTDAEVRITLRLRKYANALATIAAS